MSDHVRNTGPMPCAREGLAVYMRPRDPDRPLVCLDETSKQLLAETRLPIALACSKPPKGRARWTLRLLEKKVVELKIVDRASDVHFSSASTIVPG